MPAPVDPGDFQSAPVGTPVAPPYRADAAAVNLRFARLYDALDASLDEDSILNATVGPDLIEPVSIETVALINATWTPSSLTYYWIPAPFNIVMFKPIRYTASIDFAVDAVFGMMPVGRRPQSLSYFGCNRLPSNSFGSMGFSIDEDGIMAARQNFLSATDGVGFIGVEYKVFG